MLTLEEDELQRLCEDPELLQGLVTRVGIPLPAGDPAQIFESLRRVCL